MRHLIYKTRSKTDCLFPLYDSSLKFKGPVDKAIRYVEKDYLCKSDTWKDFVEVFRKQQEERGWTGEFWGKMMRGSVLTYQYTGNKELYNVLTETVLDMLTTQQPTGEFSTYLEEFKFGGWDMWCRKYVLLGFQYYLEICKDAVLADKIVKVICKHADYIMGRIGPEDGKISITKACAAWDGLPAASILEPFMRLYNLTDDKKYFDFASYIVDSGAVEWGSLWDEAYNDQKCPYEYKTRKAYEMMSCFEGVLEYYRVTGIEKYKEAAINFAKKVIESDITIIGSAGCEHELFDNSARTQLDTEYDGTMQETCVTVTWMKFCYQLLQLTGNPLYADQIEISAYNAMLGAVNEYGITDAIEGMPFDSYSPLLFSTRARLSGGFRPLEHFNYGCCGCIGSAGTALMALSATLKSSDGIFVNMYYPGEISVEAPSGNAVKLRIETEYPNSDNVKIVFVSDTEEKLKIAVRIPSYSKNNTVSINGSNFKSVDCGYFIVDREWKNGDTVDISIDTNIRTFRTEGVNEKSQYHVALYKGPVVLARDARLGEKIDSVVDVDEDENCYVKYECINESEFPVNMKYRIRNKDGSYFTVIDYASAGKTYDRNSAMTAWLATKDYWTPDFSKSIVFMSKHSSLKKYMYVGEDNFAHSVLDSNNVTPWKLEDAEDGYVRLLAPNGKYLGVLDDNPATEASVAEYTEDDGQKWKLVHFARNHYVFVHKKSKCVLYENLMNGKFRLFSTEPDSDSRYLSRMQNNNVKVNALIRISNSFENA